MYFSKLNKEIVISKNDFSKISHWISYSSYTSYFSINELIVDIKHILPERYRSNFSMLSMEVYRELPFHVDTGISVTINFYINTSDCITQFRDTQYSPIDYENSFIAKDNEVWILDVTVPHSVKYLSDTKSYRTALCLQTSTYTYAEVVRMLEETGYL